MGKKQIGLICLTAVMMGSILAGCSGNNGNTANGDNKNTTNEPGVVAEEKLEKVTFSYFNAAAGKDVETKDTTIGKIYEEQTGVNWKLEHLVGDENTKIGTFIASNDYPDVIVPGETIDKIVDAGAFIPLNDLIEEYGPNIKRVYEPYFNLMKDDAGNINFLPFSANVGEFMPDPNITQGAFWMQRRVLKEAGYPKVKTYDQYLKLIRDYVASHPEEDMIGYLALTAQDQFFAFTNPPMHLAGYPNDGGTMIDMETHIAKDYGNDVNSTKRYLQELNKLNAEGIFDKSSFVDTKDQYIAKIASGKVLGFFDYKWQAADGMNSLREASMATGNDDLDYMALPIVFDEDVKDQYLEPPSFVNNRGIGITVSAEDPIRIIKFFDNMLTDENQILNNWGIKDETYGVNEEGRFFRTEEQILKAGEKAFQQSFGFTYFNYSWPMYGGGSSFPDGNAVGVGSQPEVAQMSYTENDKKLLEAYKIESFSQLFSAPDERPWYPAWSIPVPQGSDAQVFEQKRSDLQRKYFPKMVLAAPADFEATWTEYFTEFNKLNIKAFEDVITAGVKKKVDILAGK
jgi:putative aldouronate transport system substrate-binding protein